MAIIVPSLEHEAAMFAKLNHPDSGSRRLVNAYVGDFVAQKKKKQRGRFPSDVLKALRASADEHFNQFVAATERITDTKVKP